MPKLEWIAVFKLANGKLHTFRQPSADSPEGFKKVLEEERKGNLVSFFLEEAEREKALGVNLKSGEFIFSFIFNYHPAPEIAGQNIVYRLINFRRMRKDIGTGGYNSGTYIAYYILGWQATVGGVNYQRMMFIDADTLGVTIKEKR
ncbi:hypothetical protein KAR91_13990 [Candidatus Pacearchaeota archaeon]|nr:hypothetical protein [Candidatus Pacearchaeota archaeon]